MTREENAEAALGDTLTPTTAPPPRRARREGGGRRRSAGGQAAFRDPLTNKTHFANAPFDADFGGPFYAGRVTPVVHYTMGGVRVDGRGRVVLNERRAAKTGEATIKGLYAAGEIVGGVHGKNRLGGNALTECAVFGRRVGKEVVIVEKRRRTKRRRRTPRPRTGMARQAVPEESVRRGEGGRRRRRPTRERGRRRRRRRPPGRSPRRNSGRPRRRAGSRCTGRCTTRTSNRPAGAGHRSSGDGRHRRSTPHSPGMLGRSLGSLWGEERARRAREFSVWSLSYHTLLLSPNDVAFGRAPPLFAFALRSSLFALR